MKKADIILISALLFLAAVLFLVFYAGNSRGSEAVVRVDGEVVARYPLSADGRYSLNGGTNILIISEGCAYLEDADCPDKLCVKQGKIKSTGQCITCLPNRLTVTIEGDAPAEYDLIVG